MKGQIRRILSLVLAIVMVLSIVPVSAEDSNVVVDETNTVETNPAAQIGDVEYLTLTDAFEAAQTGQTIKLLRDVDEVVRLSVSTGTEVKSITLNLNGKTWDCGYGTRINAVDLKVTNGTIGTKRSVALEAGDSIDVFYFGGHGMLPSKMDLKGVTFNAELRVNNMAPSEEELELLATTKSVGKAFNATEVTIWDSQYDVVTVQKAAYLTINGGWFSGIHAEEGAFVTDNRNKGESSDDSETTEESTEDVEVKIVTIMSTTGTRTERGVTVTFVDSTFDADGDNSMQFTVGESSTVFTVQRRDGDAWTTVNPSYLSTFVHTFDEPGSVTFRLDWDGNGTYDRLVVLVKGELYEVADAAELKAAVANANDGAKILLTADIDYTGTATLEIAKAITLDLGGYTLTTHGTYGGLSLKNEGIIVTNGKLNHAGTVAAIKVWSADVISDLEIDVTGTSAGGNTINGIVLQAGATGVRTLKNVKIHSTAGQGVATGIETYNCGDANTLVIGNMDNVTIDAKVNGMLISAPCGTATNCDIKGGVSGIEIWIKGTYSAWLQLVNSKVYGGTQAVYAHDELNSNPDIVNSGTIKLVADDATEFATSETGVLLTKEIAHINEETQLFLLRSLNLDMTTAYRQTFDDAGAGWTWDVETKTLTLNGLDYSTEDGKIIVLPDGATVVLVGENKIATTATDAVGIYAAGAVTIQGDSLDITLGSGNAIYAEKAGGNAIITIDGAELTANGGIATADTAVNASLILKNANVNVGRNSISIRNDNGTRGETGVAGTATIDMSGSYLYTGPVFVGAHLSSNHSYTRSSAVFKMSGSSIDIQGGGKAAMIYVWGDCDAAFQVSNSNVKIWNSGWQYSDIDIQGGNDHYGVSDGVVIDVDIINSNLDMYGYWSGITVKRYYGDSAKIDFNVAGSTISTMTKYGSSGISVDDSTDTGTTTKSITDSITFLTNDLGHSGTSMEVNATIYGNPTLSHDFTIVQQTGGTNDFSTVEYDFVLGEGQTITINAGKTFTSAKPITMMPGSKIVGNYVGEVIVPEEYAAEGYVALITGEGDEQVIEVLVLKAEIVFSAFGGSETSIAYPGDADSLQGLVDYYFFCNDANENAMKDFGISEGDYTPTLVIYGDLGDETATLGNTNVNAVEASGVAAGGYKPARPMTWTIKAEGEGVTLNADNFVPAEGYAETVNEDGTITVDWTVFEIWTVEDMQTFQTMVTEEGQKFSGKTVKLMADIDLAGIEWSPIGGDSVYFAGEFAGNDHTISNLTQTTGARMGLFGLIEKAYIHDLTLANVSFTVNEDSARVGAIAGNLQYWNVIKNVTIDGINITVNADDGLIGAVAGYVWKSQMGNVDVNNAVITVNGTGNVIGGNTGYGRAHVWDTGVTGNNAHWLDGTVQTINGTEYVLQNYYEGCDVSGITINLNGSGNEAGGFFGSDTYNSHSNYFVNCHVSGLDVTAAAGTSQTVGGFIAWNNGTTSAGTVKGFSGCSVTGTIKGANGTYGGFAGQVGGRACEYNNATANVNITSSGTAGGFVGITQAYSTHKYTFNNCTATGNVSGAIAGGFTGKNGLGGDGKSVYVEYNNCSASGVVEGSTYAGGLIGYVNTELPATNWNIVDSTGSLILNGNTAAVNVTGDSVVGYLIGYLDGVANGDAKEGNTLEVDLTDNTPDGSDIGTGTGHHINISGDTIKEDIVLHYPVAKVDGEYYETLTEAVTAANAIEGGATVELLADVTLGEKLTITNDVTIKGEYTITRAADDAATADVNEAYTGTLFAVSAGATLTLDGGLTIDGGNNYAFNSELYESELAAGAEISSADKAKWFTPEEGAPVATTYMITTSGTVNLNDVTIQNNYSNSSGIVSASTGSTVNLNGATITHNAMTSGSGLVVNASSGKLDRTPAIWVNMNGGTTIDGNHVGGNHGVFKVYMGTVFTMNGGTIKNTTGWNSNGVVVGVYWATFNMNGGTICSNSSVGGPNNTRNAAVYVHNSSEFTMSDGTICHNTGAYGGLDMRNTTSNSATITGGSIVNNNSVSGNAYYDVNGNAQTTITGGTYSQDVTQWLAPDHGLAYDAETGYYTVTEEIAEINGEVYKSIAAAAEVAKDGDTIKLLTGYRPSVTAVIDKDVTLDLNGKTVYGYTGVNPIIRVLANVTVTGNGMIDSANYGDGYCFIVGSNDASGNLTIENGTFKGTTTAASVTKGTLTILGGDFRVKPYEDSYDFLLNCIDANYKDGSAKIVVKGGTFTKFDPMNNAAEGAGTNFVAEGYISETLDEGATYTVRVNRDTLPTIAEITFTDSNSGETVTLKYPSERYDTIQKLIGTNDYADFVLGAEQSELLAYVANGTASNIVMTLHDDVALDAPINFYNKYFQMDAKYDITLDGNGHTITWADGYTGTLLNVESGVSLTTKNVTIDGENAFTFYNDTTTVEDGQNWYTRFVDVGEEDKAVNANVITNAGNLTLGTGTVIKNVTIATESDNGKTKNTETGGYYLMYNDDLAVIYSTGGTVSLNGATISGNAGMILNADNTTTTLNGATINGNMGCGRNGGVIDLAGGTMTISNSSINGNKAMARCATIIGVTTNAVVTMNSGSIDNNKQIGVGSNTAGSMIVVREGSKFIMNGGSISNNAGGRAGAIASRFATADANIILNAGTITGNTASNDSWNGASIFLRSPAEIHEGMNIDGAIVVNASPAALTIDGGTVYGSMSVADGLTASITGGTFNYDPTEWVAEGYEAIDNGDGTWTVQEKIYAIVEVEIMSGVWGKSEIKLENWADFEAALGENTNLPVKVTIMSDLELEKALTISGTKTVELNLNGKTITSTQDAIVVEGGVSLTINGDGAVKGGTSGVGSWTAVWANGGNVVINGGTYSVGGDKNATDKTHQNDVIYTKNDGTVTINGGTFLNDGTVWTLNENDANRETITVYGGTFHNWNPEDNVSEGPNTDFVAEGYLSETLNEGATYIVRKANYIAQVGDVKYESLQEAINACTAGETVKLIADIVYDADDIVYAHGGGTGFGKYDASNPSIIYTGGTNVDGVISPSTVNAVLDLNGHTITNNADAYMFMIMDNAKLTFKDSVGTGSITNNAAAPVIWAVGTETLVKIESGKYVTANNEGLLWSTHGADMVIDGGNFSTTADDASMLIVRSEKDRNNAAHFVDGNATITIYGGTYNYNPEKTYDDSTKPYTEFNAVADGYIARQTGENTWVVGAGEWVAQVGEKLYEDFFTALEDAKVAEDKTVILLKSIELTEDKEIDLDGVTVKVDENLSAKPAFRVLANVTVKNGTVDATDGTSTYAFIVGNSTTAGTLTIADGTYKGDVSAISITNGTANISGGTFEATEYNGAHEFTLNCIDSAYNNGTAVYNITGGKFYKFNPENNAAEGANTNFLAEKYTAVQNGDYYEVMDYVTWVKAELLAGNSVTLDRDVKITDYSYVNALKLPSNGNGKYTEVHGNGAVFHVIKPGVVFDLNGHNITWDAHDDAYCNARQVSLFMVTITGNAGETSSLTIKNSVEGEGKVNVYGMGTGVYVVGVDAKATITGGEWTNYPCKTCGASNIFMYPSHGGEMYITGGAFNQVGGEYLLGWKGSTKTTANNGVGTDFDATKLAITGGKYIGFNPELTKFFDIANSGQETINGVAEGYIARETEPNVWVVVKGEWVAQIGDVKYASVQEAVDAALAGETVKLIADVAVTETINVADDDEIVLDLNGHKLTNVIPAEATVFHTIKNSGKLTVIDSVGGGEIQSNSAKGYVIYTECGSLVVDGAKITGINNGYAIVTWTAGDSVTIEEGTVIEGRGALYVDGGATGTVNGGTFTMTVQTTNPQDNVVYVGGASELTINGGTFTTGDITGAQRVAVTALGSANVTINGGSFYGTTDDLVTDNSATISVTNGTFTGTQLREKKDTSTISLTGGTYSYDPAEWVAKGYKEVDNGDGTWTVKPLVTVTFDDVTMVEGNELPEFTYTTNFTEVAEDGTMLVVEDPVVTLEEGVTEYEITANAYVFMNDAYAVEVIPGKLTVEKCVVKVNGVAYSSWISAMEVNDTTPGNKDYALRDAKIELFADIVEEGDYEHRFYGTTELDLNGFNFYTKRAVTVSGTTTIIDGGTFNTGTDGWPLVLVGNVVLDPSVEFQGTLQFNEGSKGNLIIGDEYALGNASKYSTNGSDAYVRVVFKNGLQEIDLQNGHVTLTKNDGTLDNQNINIGANATFTIAEGVTLTLNSTSTVVINGTVNGEGTVEVNTIEHFKQILSETEILKIKLGSAMTLDDELLIEKDVFVTGMANLTVTGTLTLTAGTYDMNVNKYCAEGYGARNNGDGTWTVVAAPIEFRAIQLSVEAEVVLKLKFYIPAEVLADENGYAILKEEPNAVVPSGFEKKYTMAEIQAWGADSSGRYTFTQGIAAGEMTGDVSVEFYNSDDELIYIRDKDASAQKVLVRTVLDFAEAAVKGNPEKEAELVAAMLTFGGYAQAFFEVDTENPAYNKLAEIGLAKLDVSNPQITQELTKSDTDIGVQYASQKVNLNSSIYMRTYFTLDEGASIEDYKFELTYPVNNKPVAKEVQPTKQGSRYYVDAANVPVAYWDFMYKITVTKIETGETYEVGFSVLAWAQRCIANSPNSAEVNMAKAMYFYNRAANDYFKR